jgi:hypothetical protein
VEPDAARTQPGRNKACTECARARERCSKDDVCLRCITRNLICLYPERRRGRKSISELSRPQSHIEAPSTEAPSTLHVEQLDQSPLSEAQLHLHAQEQSYVDYELSSAERMGHTPNNAENTWPIDYDHMSWATNVDAPINWLPVNIGTDLDYSSMLGSGLNFSFDSLPLQQPMNVPFPDAAETSTAASMGPIVLDSGQPQPHAPDSLTIRRTEFRDSDTIHGNRQSEKGSLYATSNDGARTSRSAKPHTTPSDTYDIQNTSPIPLSQEHVDNIGTGFGFLNLPDIYPNQLQDLGQIPDALQPSTYVAIHEQFINLCTISNVMFPQFSSSMFPSILHFNYFISLYFEYFHPTLPIVHRPSLDLNTNWHLATAISAIGSQYAPTNRVTKCSISLVEFLRRTIVVETENLDNSFTNLSLVQTMTLCQLGLVYSGYSKFQSASRNVHGRLINIIYTKGYLTQQTNLDPFDWQSWIFQETRKRLGYCIFVSHNLPIALR